MQQVISKKNTFLSLREASEITGRSISDIEQLCRTGIVESKVVAGEWHIATSALLNHFNLSLGSEIPLSHLADLAQSNSASQILPASAQALPFLGKVTHALAAFVLVFGGSYVAVTPEGRVGAQQTVAYLGQALDRSTDAMAYVGQSTVGLFEGASLASAYTSFSAIFAQNDVLSADTGTVSGGDQVQSSGAVIVPSTGDTSADALVREKIEASFSDQVEVVADASGRSGVITPVFKAGRGQPYMYVMVPISD